MKTARILAATACTLFFSTTAFAQIRPSDSNTTNNGSMTTAPQPGFGTTPDGRLKRSNKNSMNGRMRDNTKMSGRKGTKKTKMSTMPSSTGTM